MDIKSRNNSSHQIKVWYLTGNIDNATLKNKIVNGGETFDLVKIFQVVNVETNFNS